MSLRLLDDQRVSLSVQPVDAGGNPALIDGAPEWEVIGATPSILTYQPADDGLSCDLETTGLIGTAQVRVSADARIGPDVRSISGILDIEVEAGEAVTLNIAAGTPQPR